MVDVPLLDRLGTLASRKRWLVGLSVSAHCRWLHAALVGVEGAGLAARAEIFAYRRAPARRECRRLFARTVRDQRARSADAALLGAQLAENQAALLDDFSADVAPVWNRVLVVAVRDFGLWHRRAGLRLCVALGDASRLADLSGLNVVDAFAARDLAQDGRGRPLSPIPDWLLLHHAQKNRLLVEWGRHVRLTWLPASRDASGAGRVLHYRPRGSTPLAETRFVSCQDVAKCVFDCVPVAQPLDEIIVDGPASLIAGAVDELAAMLPGAACIATTDLGIPPCALRPAGGALLGLLHLDQVPANSTAITGVRTPRVLGRLTPGSLASWHRLVSELAAARPSVISLRSAV
jgi:1,6-anhydro-N-acetylmuramate kinase